MWDSLPTEESQFNATIVTFPLYEDHIQGRRSFSEDLGAREFNARNEGELILRRARAEKFGKLRHS